MPLLNIINDTLKDFINKMEVKDINFIDYDYKVKYIKDFVIHDGIFKYKSKNHMKLSINFDEDVFNIMTFNLNNDIIWFHSDKVLDIYIPTTEENIKNKNDWTFHILY